MKRFLIVRITSVALAAAMCGAGSIEYATANTRIANEWRFNVLLDDKPIGYHRFQLNGIDGARELTSEARFNVKFLFITMYSYVHDTTELWRGECLAKIDASTDDNGAKKIVRGAPTDGRFIVATGNASTPLESCVMTFAYWNPLILEAAHLLNPQTGEYVPVQITHMGVDTLTVRGAQRLAKRFRLIGDATIGAKLQIDLWYSADKQWLALESITPEGHRLRYRMQ